MNKNELARDVFIKLVTAGKVSKHPVGIGHKLNVHKKFNLRRELRGGEGVEMRSLGPHLEIFQKQGRFHGIRALL